MSLPRVLVVMETQWHRALLLAALQEAGYDTLGATNLTEALAYPAEAPGLAPIGLIILDHHISRDDPLLAELLRRHRRASSLYLESALLPSRTTEGERLRYPISIGEVVQKVVEMTERLAC